MINPLIQYILVGIILLCVLIYVIRHFIRLFQQKHSSGCDSCSMNQGCHSPKK